MKTTKAKMRAIRVVAVGACAALALFMLAACGQTSSMEVDKWDGSADTSWYAEGQSEYHLSSAEQFAGLAELVDSGVTFEGAKVSLDVNVDLCGLPWNPIGGDPSNAQGTFMGDFDGNGNSISNLYIVSPLGFQALFGSVSHGTLSNFTLDGTVKGRESAAGVASDANCENFINIVTDVDVFSTNYYNNVDTAGLCGHYFADEPGTTFRIKDCVNNGSIDANDWTVSGLVAFIGLTDGTSIEVENCTNSGYVAVDAYSKAPDNTVAGLVSELGSFGSYTFKNCKNTADVSGTDIMAVSGLIGTVAGDNTSIINCSNSGNVSTGTLNDRSIAAGIVASSTALNGYHVEGCTNTGELSTYNGSTIDIAAGRVS